MIHRQPHTTPPHFNINSRHTIVTLLIISTIILITTSLFTLHLETTLIADWEILTVNSCYISFPIIIDPTGTFMAATVLFISFNIFIFSNTYMNNDPNQTRFSYLLLLFVSSIIILIFSPNLITLILGWDGLGVTSFLLVIYYPTTDALNSGIVTALTNRVGDCLLLGSIALMLSQGQWNSWSLWSNSITSPTTLALLIILAAITNSAQLPFIFWLPEAIAAPTPVSALVHSSTLVTAGVYIIIRFYPFIASVGPLNSILSLSSTFTLIASGIWATVELDINNIIALSTLSQIGLIMLCLSIGLTSLAYLHLVTHAIFNSLLFLTAGIHITISHHQQNLQNLVSNDLMPSLAFPATVSLASLNAFFFTAGYYSNDLLLETSLFIPNDWIFEQLITTAIGSSLGSTITYTIRLHRVLCNSTNLVFPDGSIDYHLHRIRYVNDYNSSIRTPLIWLTFGSLIIGSIAVWAFITPNETPSIQLEGHIAPWFWTFLGGAIALMSCAGVHNENIPYIFERSLNNIILDLIRPLIHFFSPSYPVTSSYTPPNSYLNIEFYHGTDNIETNYRIHNAIISGISYITFGIVPYIIALSTNIFNILDQGWFEIYPPFSTNASSTSASSNISNIESTTLTIIIFLLTIIFLITILFIANLFQSYNP